PAHAALRRDAVGSRELRRGHGLPRRGRSGGVLAAGAGGDENRAGGRAAGGVAGGFWGFSSSTVRGSTVRGSTSHVSLLLEQVRLPGVDRDLGCRDPPADPAAPGLHGQTCLVSHTKTWDSRVSVSEEMREDAAADRRRFLGVYRESGAQLYRYALMI